MADENVNLEVSGFGSLRAQIREATLEYQQLLTSVNSTPEAIAAAAAKVADLKDQFDDANDAVSALTGAGKIQAFGKGLAAISGGFTAVQGAISLAGGDAKDFEKTMQKLQGAMALTQGLSQLEDLGNAFGNMKKVAVNAFNSIKTAIGATGIGLLVVALGAIYAYWDDIKAAVSGVSAEQEELNKQSAENLAMQEKNLSAIDAQENILKLQGKSEEEIYQMKVKQYDQTIQAAKVNLANLKATQKAEEEATQRNMENLQMLIRLVTAPITILLVQLDEIGKVLGKNWNLEEKFSGGIAKLVFDPKSVKEEGKKTIEEAEKKLTELENKRAGLVLQHNEKQKTEAKAKLDKQKEENKKENDLQKEHLKNLEKLKDDQYIQESATEEERARRSLEKKQEQQDEELQLLIKSYTDKKKLTKEEEESLAVLRKEYDQLQITQKAETDALLKKQADDAAKKAAEDEKKAKEEREAAVKDEYEKTKGYVDDYYKSKQTALLNSDLSAKELADKSEQLELERLEAQKKAAEDYGQSIIDIDNQIAEIKRKNKEEERAAFYENLQFGLDTASSLASSIMDLDKAKTDAILANENLTDEEREKAAKEGFERQKKLQYALAVIDGAKAVTAILSVPDFTLGVKSAIQIALAGITTAMTLAKISSTQYQSKGGGAKSAKPAGSAYAMGGLLGGPSHDLGGIKTSLGELEGGEFVVNRRSTMDFLPLLDQINSVGQTPGPQVPMMQQQPIVKTYVVASDMTSQQEADAKLKSLAKL